MNIIVTGASRGIGREVVKLLAKSGNHSIVAISRSTEKLESLKVECKEINAGTEIYALSKDLGIDTDKLVREILELLPTIDVLINNAGKLISKSVQDFTDQDFTELMEVNLGQVFRLVRGLYPHMNTGSHMVNIGSMGGYQGSSKFPGLSLYSAAKGALAVFSECLAEEFKEEGIKVNCLALGAAQTEMLESAFPGYKAPLSATQMAEFIADFALNGHRFFNGKVLPVSLSTP